MAKINIPKLEGMTKEEKLALYDRLQLKKKLDKRTRARFMPHKGQLPVCKSDKYIRLVTAGNGFGKTSLGVNEALWAAEGFHPVKKIYTKTPSVGIVVLDSPMKVKEVHLKEMDKWVDLSEVEQIKNGKPYVNELVFKNGSRILFMFHEQEDATFESMEMDWVIYDEPPLKRIFTALSRGQRTKGSKPWTLIIGTPLAAAWLRQDLFEPWERGERDDVECFRGSTEQNKDNLKEGYIEQFSKLLSEEEKKIRLEGQWFDLGGLALKHLIKPEIHYIPKFAWPADDPVVIAIDPHPSKAHCAVAIGRSKRTKRRYVIGELSAKATAKDFAVRLMEWSREWKVVDWVVDSLGSSDGTGNDGFKSFIQVLKDCGIRCRATSFEDKSDEAWIDRIRTVLEVPEEADNYGERLPKLQFFDSCYNVRRDLENVSWLKYRNIDEYKQKLDISNKDYLACVKYALASNALETGMSPISAQIKRIGGETGRKPNGYKKTSRWRGR